MHDLEDEDIFEEELILRKPKKRTWGRTFSTTTAKRGIWGQALKYSVAFVVGAAVLGATAKLGRAAYKRLGSLRVPPVDNGGRTVVPEHGDERRRDLRGQQETVGSGVPRAAAREAGRGQQETVGSGVPRAAAREAGRQPDQAAPPSDSVPPIVFLPFLNATPNLDQLETVSVIPVPDLRWLTNYLPSGREVAGRLQRLLGRRQ